MNLRQLVISAFITVRAAVTDRDEVTPTAKVNPNQQTTTLQVQNNLPNLQILSLFLKEKTGTQMQPHELVNLEMLDLATKKLVSLPKEIGDLKNLQDLVLARNPLTSLPKELGNLKNLQRLVLDFVCLDHLPSELGNLTNLQILKYGFGKLKSLPNEIGNLKNLEVLYLPGNNLSGLPIKIGDLVSLQSLNLNCNKLTDIPKELGNLPNIQRLYLGHNNLTSIPEELGNLSSLTYLGLSNNGLTSIPNSLSNLSNLEVLYLNNNQLSDIPEDLGKLTNLKDLNLSSNHLSNIPEVLGKLINLKDLNLSSNHLTSIPEELGNIKTYNRLQLQNNRLKMLPSSFGRLNQTLSVLNLLENLDFLDYGEGDNLGKIELQRIYGDKVVFDKVEKVENIVEEDEFLKNMKNKEIYWNLDVLSAIKSEKVKENTLNETEMIEILNKAKSNNLISDNGQVMLMNYVKKLFHTNIKYKGWVMKKQYIPTTVNLLGNILEYLNSKFKSKDLISVPFSLEDIAEGITYCPDRQMAELKRAYSLINGNTETELDNFIFQIIETMKDSIFELAVTPVQSGQNVHVLNFWKYEMRKTLGFDFEFKTGLGTMGQDPFGGHRGNALHAFFSKFTPNYVISNLTDLINDNKTVVCELMKIIKEDESLSNDEKIAMGFDIEYSMSDKLTEKAIEYILIKKELLVKN